jgi:hypothetical protein
MKSKRNIILFISGIGIIWLLWFIFSILDILMNDYERIDLVAFILLFLIVLTPLFFGILLNLHGGVIIGFFGTLIPAILFLDSHYGTTSIFLAIMVLSMSSSLLKLVNSNIRQEELIILHQELKKIKSFYVSTVDWARNHPLLTTLVLSLVASIVGGLIVYLIM